MKRSQIFVNSLYDVLRVCDKSSKIRKPNSRHHLLSSQGVSGVALSSSHVLSHWIFTANPMRQQCYHPPSTDEETEAPGGEWAPSVSFPVWQSRGLIPDGFAPESQLYPVLPMKHGCLNCLHKIGYPATENKDDSTEWKEEVHPGLPNWFTRQLIQEKLRKIQIPESEYPEVGAWELPFSRVMEY